MNGQTQDQYHPRSDKKSEEQESVNDFRSIHKDGSEVDNICEEVVEGVSILGLQNNAGMHIDSFDAVALNLEEAMAFISE